MESESQEDEGNRNKDSSSQPGSGLGRIPKLNPTYQAKLSHEEDYTWKELE